MNKKLTPEESSWYVWQALTKHILGDLWDKDNQDEKEKD